MASIEALLKLVPRQTQKAQQKPYGDMTVALRRFNQSYDRDTFEDKIIDLTIALESTLLAGLEDELKYRLAIRGAALLANMWEPQKSQLLLKTIYDVRSSIVHNGMQLNDPKMEKLMINALPGQTEPNGFFLSCENIVRDTLRTYINRLSKGQSLEQLNDDLEKYVIKGITENCP